MREWRAKKKAEEEARRIEEKEEEDLDVVDFVSEVNKIPPIRDPEDLADPHHGETLRQTYFEDKNEQQNSLNCMTIENVRTCDLQLKKSEFS